MPRVVKAFEGGIVVEVMEGGLATDELLAPYQPAVKTASEVLDVAMMIETQPLALYLRCSQKADDKKSKSVIHDIAEEGKAHLRALGRLRAHVHRGGSLHW